MEREDVRCALFWVKDILKRCRYKAGWKLESSELPSYLGSVDVYLRISFRTEDTYHPGQMVTIASRDLIPDSLIGYPDRFLRWLQSRLLEAERHEMQEWFRVDGELYDNPHR